MRKLATQLAVGAMVLSSVAMFGATSSASADTTTTTVAPTTTTTAPSPTFVSGNKWLTVNVDTVVSHDAQGSCLLQNVFTQGQTVVFRMWGIDNSTGKPLIADSVGANGSVVYMKGANVTSAIIKSLPGMPGPVRMSYNTHDGYFTYGWATSTKTPTGVVPYKVVVTLAPVAATYKTIKVKVNGKWTTKKVVKTPAIPSHSYAYFENGSAIGNGSLAAPSQVTINAVA